MLLASNDPKISHPLPPLLLAEDLGGEPAAATASTATPGARASRSASVTPGPSSVSVSDASSNREIQKMLAENRRERSQVQDRHDKWTLECDEAHGCLRQNVYEDAQRRIDNVEPNFALALAALVLTALALAPLAGAVLALVELALAALALASLALAALASVALALIALALASLALAALALVAPALAALALTALALVRERCQAAVSQECHQMFISVVSALTGLNVQIGQRWMLSNCLPDIFCSISHIIV